MANKNEQHGFNSSKNALKKAVEIANDNRWTYCLRDHPPDDRNPYPDLTTDCSGFVLMCFWGRNSQQYGQYATGGMFGGSELTQHGFKLIPNASMSDNPKGGWLLGHVAAPGSSYGHVQMVYDKDSYIGAHGHKGGVDDISLKSGQLKSLVASRNDWVWAVPPDGGAGGVMIYKFDP